VVKNQGDSFGVMGLLVDEVDGLVLDVSSEMVEPSSVFVSINS